jgi:hypothetical protein
MYLSLFILFLIISNSFLKVSKEYSNLIKWIEKNNGYISKKVEPIEESIYNRIIKSSKKIEKGELLGFIPEKVVISSINYLVNPECRKAYGVFHEKDLECIAFFFTIDKNNPNSFFKPYYDYLPDFDLKAFPSEFPKNEQKLYDEIDLYLHIGIHDNKIKYAYNDSVEKIFKEKNISNSFKEFKYNFYIAQSRNFSRPNSKFMSDLNSIVPFLDLFNHDNNFNCDWDYDEDKKGFILRAIKDVEKGQELTITYGEVDNINLFVIYGFTFENNKYKTPIRVKLDEFKYTFYPGLNEVDNKKDLIRVKKTLEEKYEDNDYIYKLMYNGLKKKLENVKLIKLDNINVRNIVNEVKENIIKYIIILEKDFLK